VPCCLLVVQHFNPTGNHKGTEAKTETWKSMLEEKGKEKKKRKKKKLIFLISIHE